MAQVVLDHVTKRFGSVTAVNDLCIEIEDKEFLVLVGPSGCGKTTALRMVAGLEEITSGNIYIGDRLVNDVSPKDRDIAMVFQSYALYPHMNVYDNMAFGLKMRKFSRDEIDKRVKVAAGILGIEMLLDRKPKQLSGGQRQRVALGRAIVREPKVFLMDEPLSNLDAKLRVQMRAELIKLHQRLQTTIIYVTHDQIEAMTMGSRIAVMRDGVLQQLDTPQKLYQDPANVFVAGFIGSPAMNFFEVQITTEGGTVTLTGEGFSASLAGTRAQAVAPYNGKRVVVGIRPEHLAEVSSGETDETGELVAQVEVVESMGSEQHLYLLVGGKSFVARVDGYFKARVGDQIKFAFPKEQMRLFDKDTERAIVRAAEMATV
ncbi:MAG TPA: sn-glycerol-3-phosphate ABC transporter ATP-binding protein UgpC [Chloroflexota bacterium]|nr:sn-glycerol-3-phosphate ABC transporter ATP-binding protein UgpC [Chloroflexota bacterium]